MKKLLLLLCFSSWAVAYETERRSASSVDDVACLVAGYGDTFGDAFYLGVESLWEIGSRKSKDIFSDSYKGKITRRTGSVQLGARVGCVFRDIEALFFLKGGYALAGKNEYELEKIKFHEYGELEETPLAMKGKTKNGVPFFSLGGEKVVCNGVSVRLEAGVQKGRPYERIYGSSQTKNIRLLFIWNFNNI